MFAFLHVSEYFESIEIHFFFKNCASERKAQNAQDVSAKPEGAKRPSSPARLARRQAKRASRPVG